MGTIDLVTPQSEIYARLQQLGWEVSKIDFKGGRYVAEADSAHGQSFTAIGQTPEMALVGIYNHASRANDTRMRSISRWQHNWYKDLHEIAQAYRDLPQFEEGAQEAWMALAQECQAHSVAIQQQIQVELSDEFQPYESPVEMREDVHKKSRLLVSRIETNHPLWTEQEVIDFRVCHDVLGICQSGGGWSWPGANMAAANHLPLLSPLAQEALFVEVVGRTAYETVYRGLGGPKVALMSDLLRPVQEEEGVHVHVPHSDWYGVTAGWRDEWPEEDEPTPEQLRELQREQLRRMFIEQGGSPGALETWELERQLDKPPPPNVPDEERLAKTAERDPNYLYVYYGSELHVQPFSTNLKHENLLRELFDEFGVDFGNTFMDVDPLLVDAGRVFVENEALRIEHDQLNSPEVREQAEDALRAWWAKEQWHSWREEWFEADEWESLDT